MDRNMEYHSESQTLIGQKKRTLVDKDTGEIIQVDQITKRVYGTKRFWKVYLMDFLNILGIMDNKQLDVFIYIAENTNQTNNLFIGSYRTIADDVKVSLSTVTRIMKKLQENDFIKKVQNGVYQVNPNIMMKGNDSKRQILLSYYNDEKELNTTQSLNTSKNAQNDVLEPNKPNGNEKPSDKKTALETPEMEQIEPSDNEDDFSITLGNY